MTGTHGRTARLGLTPLEDRTVPAASFRDLPVVPVIDGPMQANLEQVAAAGRARGNRENVLAKVGDSITAQGSNFLYPLGKVGYDPVAAGLPADLVGTWATYLALAGGPAENSYTRNSTSAIAAHSGLQILPFVGPELNAIRPGVVLIMIGTNDWMYASPELFRNTLRQTVQTAIASGVVPVISTIPDDYYVPGQNDTWVPAANQVIADVGDELEVPVWNFWRALQDLPGHGLADGLHPNTSPLGGGDFSAASLQFGYNVRNLTALQVLQKLQQLVFQHGTADGASTDLTTTAWTPLTAGQAVAAVGAPGGSTPTVTVVNPTTGVVLARFVAFEASFRGGVNVAVGDVDGDGVPDIVAAAGPGGGPLVKAFSGTDGRELFAVFAYESTFRGGVTVSVGDVDGDGANEVVVGTGVGGGPRVRAFRDLGQTVVLDFLAFEPTFRGGVNVAAGHFAAGPGIAVSPKDGGGPVVALFDGRTGAKWSAFAAFDASLRGGVSVAAGDLDGDGVAELVVGAGRGASPVVKVIDTATAGVRAAFLVGDDTSRRGANAAVVGSTGRIVSAAFSGRSVRAYDALGTLLADVPTPGGLDWRGAAVG